MLRPDPRFAVLDQMTGREFEEALVDLFVGLGYSGVRRIGGFSDMGVDIVATSDDTKIGVQAKRWSRPVGIAAIRALIDGVKRQECDRGRAVTTHFFTKEATKCAAAWGIELWDRRILGHYLEGEPEEIDDTICAECAKPVSDGVTTFCLTQPARFGGRVYCPFHQRCSNRAA